MLMTGVRLGHHSSKSTSAGGVSLSELTRRASVDPLETEPAPLCSSSCLFVRAVEGRGRVATTTFACLSGQQVPASCVNLRCVARMCCIASVWLN